MKTLLILSLLALTQVVHAQSEADEEEYSKTNIGFGIGLTYGGIGMRLSVLPARHIALFAAGGYNIDGLGYNLGTQIRIAPDKSAVPYFLAMYGYNSVIVVQGGEHLNGTYYGPSIGGGVEFHSRNQQNFFTAELLVPFRPAAFKEDMDALKNMPSIEIIEPWPVLIGVGYHIKL
jgi:hypothetical protein